MILHRLRKPRLFSGRTDLDHHKAALCSHRRHRHLMRRNLRALARPQIHRRQGQVLAPEAGPPRFPREPSLVPPATPEIQS